VTDLAIPATWIAEWTAELGRLAVLSRSEATVVSGAAEITFRADRKRWRFVVFDLP